VLHVTHNARQLDRDLAEFAARLGSLRTPMLRWGQAVAKQARDTARARPGKRFWADLARSVQVRAVAEESVSVHSTHVAAAQKQFGGPIVPKPGGARALTIPITDEARGKRAAEFEAGGRDLFVLPRDQGDTVGILGYSDGRDTFHALFVLRRRVVQKPEPWWPTADEAIAHGNREFARHIQEQLRRI